MKNFPANLPFPSSDALAHSAALINLIRQEIANNSGKITFARFMELALYAPGLGYYSAGCWKFGRVGDFVTAPEISPLFARCLAQQCRQVLEVTKEGGIIEFGAGTGKLAVDLLLELEKLNCLPIKYSVLEVSAELRVRQQEFCKANIPHLFERLVWLDELPAQPINGVVLANEVLDAMPVNKFLFDKGRLEEFYVGCKGNEFVWCLNEPSTNSPLLLEEGGRRLDEDVRYEFELNLNLPAWISSISQCLNQGVVLLIDYGFPQHEYFHPDRTMGTLMCHYQHHAHPDPLILVGLQDITAHVDFTAVAETAVKNNMQVAGFTTQAAFLLNCGLLNLIDQASDDLRARLNISQQINMLTSPAEMGELFKVIALTKHLTDINLLGFRQFDQRQRL